MPYDINEKLCLGTVQLGLEYGINNKLGKPCKEKAFAILDEAINSGIKYFDTAVAYGEAEDILGEYIGLRGINSTIKVISKSYPNLNKRNIKNYFKYIEKTLKQSIEKLKISKLEGYLIHTAEDFYNKEILYALDECKRKGLVENIGVSIYETDHAIDVVKCKFIDYIQVPYNILDQRINQTDFLELAKKNNIKVFGRSSFLQGLLFMDIDDVPSHLSEVKPYLSLLDNILNRYEITRLEAALMYVYLDSGIDYLIFGVDSVEQLKKNIEIINLDKDYKSCFEIIKKEFKDIPKKIVIPSLW